MRGLSADLYALREGGPKRVKMSKEELKNWQEAGQHAKAGLDAGEIDATLAFLRKPIPVDLPSYVTPFLQSRCWEKLGDVETALVFMKQAERQNQDFNPSRGLYYREENGATAEYFGFNLYQQGGQGNAAKGCGAVGALCWRGRKPDYGYFPRRVR